jgi:hypothetical protein
MLGDSSLKILHCPLNEVGNPAMLARAERALGLDSRLVAFHGDRFVDTADKVLFAPGDGLMTRERKRFALLWEAMRKADVVHFNFGRSILAHPTAEYPVERAGYLLRLKRLVFEAYIGIVQMRDLPLLRALGKTIAVTFQGDDARQGDACRRLFSVRPPDELYTYHRDAWNRKVIAAFARYSDLIYALNPDLLRVLPKGAAFLPYGHIDLSDWTPVSVRNETPLMVHAPSNPAAKGTAHVLAAVEQLKADGVPFEFVLVENMPRAEARQIYERADLLVDQLLYGWYGGLAVEFMALGKPVVAYIREGDLAFLPKAMRDDLPVVNAAPEDLHRVLHKLLTGGRDRLKNLGRRSRSYVERWHDPRLLAARLAADYHEAGSRRGGGSR